jgi:hypothetical protein
MKTSPASADFVKNSRSPDLICENIWREALNLHEFKSRFLRSLALACARLRSAQVDLCMPDKPVSQKKHIGIINFTTKPGKDQYQRAKYHDKRSYDKSMRLSCL